MPFDFRYNQPPLELFKTYKSVEDYGAIEYFKQEKATTIMNTLKVLGGKSAEILLDLGIIEKDEEPAGLSSKPTAPPSEHIVPDERT